MKNSAIVISLSNMKQRPLNNGVQCWYQIGHACSYWMAVTWFRFLEGVWNRCVVLCSMMVVKITITLKSLKYKLNFRTHCESIFSSYGNVVYFVIRPTRTHKVAKYCSTTSRVFNFSWCTSSIVNSFGSSYIGAYEGVCQNSTQTSKGRKEFWYDIRALTVKVLTRRQKKKPSLDPLRLPKGPSL